MKKQPNWLRLKTEENGMILLGYIAWFAFGLVVGGLFI